MDITCIAALLGGDMSGHAEPREDPICSHLVPTRVSPFRLVSEGTRPKIPTRRSDREAEEPHHWDPGSEAPAGANEPAAADTEVSGLFTPGL
jgi:hypothetical protein